MHACGRIKEQIEGVERALELEAACAEVLRQLASVRGAMNGLPRSNTDRSSGRYREGDRRLKHGRLSEAALSETPWGNHAALPKTRPMPGTYYRLKDALA